MTNEEKLEAIRTIVHGADKEVIRYYEEDFDPWCHADCMYDAWVCGMADGTVEVCKEILEILNK